MGYITLSELLQFTHVIISVITLVIAITYKKK